MIRLSLFFLYVRYDLIKWILRLLLILNWLLILLFKLWLWASKDCSYQEMHSKNTYSNSYKGYSKMFNTHSIILINIMSNSPLIKVPTSALSSVSALSFRKQDQIP